MSNLENLISKIVAESKEKASSIIDEANAQAKKIEKGLLDTANKEKDEIISAGTAEAQRKKDLLIAKKKIEIRDSKLFAKQNLIQRVFDMAVEKLNQLSLADYEAFLFAYLSKMPLDGDEVLLVPKQYAELNIEALNEKLSSPMKAIRLTMRQDEENIKGGFILLKDGAQNNNTFEALIDYYRDDLEKIISDSLF